jgi:hypothetical protein
VNFLFGIKFKLRNTFETFLKMGLYFQRLLGLERISRSSSSERKKNLGKKPRLVSK